MKIVVNRCYGGFGLSKKAYLALREQKNKIALKAKSYGQFYSGDIERDDPTLVKVVEDLGSKANGEFAQLDVVEIPDGVNWKIEEYDGMEHVAEIHRTW